MVWDLGYEKHYVYDGWNVVAELDVNNDAIKTMTWGMDLSGSMQGAGGVGGLLSQTLANTGNTHYYIFDGNGNVTEMVDSVSGVVEQSYRYSAFGKLISETGSVDNDYKFSTKPVDEESGLLYYGLRYYSSELGRWVNRDPIGELIVDEKKGGELSLNLLFGIAKNNLIDSLDYLGLRLLTFSVTEPAVTVNVNIDGNGSLTGTGEEPLLPLETGSGVPRIFFSFTRRGGSGLAKFCKLAWIQYVSEADDGRFGYDNNLSPRGANPSYVLPRSNANPDADPQRVSGTPFKPWYSDGKPREAIRDRLYGPMRQLFVTLLVSETKGDVVFKFKWKRNGNGNGIVQQ